MTEKVTFINIAKEILEKYPNLICCSYETYGKINTVFCLYEETKPMGYYYKASPISLFPNIILSLLEEKKLSQQYTTNFVKKVMFYLQSVVSCEFLGFKKIFSAGNIIGFKKIEVNNE